MEELMNQQAGGLSTMGVEQMPQETAEQRGMTVEDVVKALMQGISPEELMKQGVPPELIKQAIEMLQSQMGGQQVPPQEQGLSQMGMQ